MIEPRDFSDRKVFPGTTGNPFDIVLHRYADLQKIPAPLFALLLGLLALPWLAISPRRALVMLISFLLDWLLLALLPVARRSFGPSQPPTLLLAVARSVFGWLPWPWLLVVQFIGTMLVIVGFWIEPQRLTVTHQRLNSPKLHPGSNLRILHLGDLHIERLTRREERLLEQIEKLCPDLILFSGDILNLSYLHDQQAWRDAQTLIRRWKAPGGAFGVAGSPAVDLPDILPALLEGMPLRLLESESIQVNVNGHNIRLVGLPCSHKPFIDAPILADLVPYSPEEFTILLYHSPDLAPHAAQMGIDLHLAGHTHGGQVRFPIIGPLFTASLYGRVFASGLYRLESMRLYITRGIGLEGAGAPRVRLFCPPEIILWEISASDPQSQNQE